MITFEKSKHREAGFKHKLKLKASSRLRMFSDTLTLVFVILTECNLSSKIVKNCRGLYSK